MLDDDSALPSWLVRHWERWGHRVLVTVAIVILYEIYQRYYVQQQPQTQQQQQQQQHRPRPRQAQDSGRRRRLPEITKKKHTIEEEAIDQNISKHDEIKQATEKKDEQEKKTDIAADENDARPEKGKATPSKPQSPPSEQPELETENDKKEEDPKTPLTSSISNSNPKPSVSSTAARSATSARATTTTTRSTPSSTTTTRQPPRIKATTNQHPGMEGFAYWCDVETSLYRIYTLTRKDGQQVVPPYVPHSHRGNISIYLNIHNATNHTIQVYWVDYKGNHIPKGTMKPGHRWTQSTFVDHPWVFEDANDATVYLYYVPYRAIPTLPIAPTVCEHDSSVAQHKFTLVPSKANDPFLIGVDDAILPFPSLTYNIDFTHGITWTLTHMSRLILPEDPSIDALQRFLTNIIENPEVVRYRQLRISSRHFKPIWESPMRGLLLAVGFVEQGGYAELGCHDYPLSAARVQEVALLSHLLREWKSKPNAVSAEQPQGAVDGFGRAGFGRAGTIN